MLGDRRDIGRGGGQRVDRADLAPDHRQEAQRRERGRSGAVIGGAEVRVRLPQPGEVSAAVHGFDGHRRAQRLQPVDPRDRLLAGLRELERGEREPHDDEGDAQPHEDAGTPRPAPPRPAAADGHAPPLLRPFDCVHFSARRFATGRACRSVTAPPEGERISLPWSSEQPAVGTPRPDHKCRRRRPSGAPDQRSVPAPASVGAGGDASWDRLRVWRPTVVSTPARPNTIKQHRPDPRARARSTRRARRAGSRSRAP